jgi:hypothetical protein
MRPAPDSRTQGIFIPVTPEASTPTPEPGITAAPARLTATVPCANNLTYRSDITIPDGMQVAPEALLDKRWEVQNSGTCNWGEGYTLRLTAGESLAAEPEQSLFPARAGSVTNLQINFQAPREPGSYRSAWQAFDPAGEPFGDPIYIEIEVVSNASTP